MRATALHKLPFSYDADALQRDLANCGVTWKTHYKPHHYAGDWAAVALYSRSGAADDLKSGPRGAVFQPTELLSRTDYIRRSVLPQFECPFKRVRFMRLAAGSEVKEHIDYFRPLTEEVRIHIPIVTNPSVIFRAGDIGRHLPAGECWYLDVNTPHSVANHGVEDRVHLVIDCELNEWLRQYLPRPLHLDSRIWAIKFQHTAMRYAWRDAKRRESNGEGPAAGIITHQLAYDLATRAGIVKAKRRLMGEKVDK